MMKRLMFLIFLGLLVRIPGLPREGTGDMAIFKGWGLAVLDHGLTSVYAHPPVAEKEAMGNAYRLPCDYPPVSPLLLAVPAYVYRALAPREDCPRLHNVLVKLPVVLLELLAALGAVDVLRRCGWGRKSLWAFAALWLNPALIVAGAYLGYQDSIFASLSLLCLLAIADNRPYSAGVVLALALLAKPQAILAAPVILAVLFTRQNARAMVLRAAVGALLVALVILLPFMLDGSVIAMFEGLAKRYAREAVLSGNCLNLWWIVAVGDGAVLATPALRLMSRLAFVAFTAANLYVLLARKGRTKGVFLCAGMQVYAYASICTGVHENHGLAALAFFAMLVIFGGQLRLVAILVSLMMAANLVLFYGLGNGPILARMIHGYDRSLLLAWINVGLFAWAAWGLFARRSAKTKMKGTPGGVEINAGHLVDAIAELDKGIAGLRAGGKR